MTGLTPPTVGTDQLTPSSEPRVALKLVVVAGPAFGEELHLQSRTYRIGKGEANDLVIPDPAVSRVHLLVSALDQAVRVTDNHSTNGSFCEGLRFTHVDAPIGTTIRLGRSALKVLPAEAITSVVRPAEEVQFEGLIGQSLAMRALFTQLEQVARTDVSVLLGGETGTGKDLCAQAIHRRSARAGGPFVVADLAGSAPTLIEAELFGHEKGAYTGAQAKREGLFRKATGGTLFLDEVGELPLELQPRLLRCLERGEVKPVGGDEYFSIDVRIVSATHRDLEKEVRAGRFREDLYYRLAGVSLTLPPLRERAEDVPLLAQHMLEKMGLSPSLLSPATLALLKGNRWPGNVRELRNVVERVVTLGASFSSTPATEAPRAEEIAIAGYKESKERIVDAFERDYLIRLLEHCGANLSRAAREAGIDRVYLRRLLRKHGLREDG